MNYKYHCQHEAESRANSIMTVPKKYPLTYGIKKDFIKYFTQLCELIKKLYLDMAKQPEAYGLVLTDFTMQTSDKKSKEAALISKSRNSVNRLPDTLFRLTQNGEVRNHQLIISLIYFKESIKKTDSCIVSAIPKFELILSRLVDFGFIISNFDGKNFDKTIDTFTLEYPEAPEIIDTLKIYCDF
jgi:hypothetical protein